MESHLKFKMILSAAVIVQIFVITIDAYKYDIIYRVDPLFSPCEIPNVYFMDRIFDMSNLNFEYLSNETSYIHGSVEFIEDIGTQDNPFTLEVFKKSRGTWVSTIYSMRRADFCKTIFDPSAIWNKLIKDVPPEDQKCPFRKGLKVNINEASEMTDDIPDPHFPGEYKIQIMIELKKLNKILCWNMFADIYRN